MSEFLLYLDDQDNSALRRGGPSAHLLFGVPTAINAGTAAYFLGEGLTRTHQLSPEQRLRPNTKTGKRSLFFDMRQKWGCDI